MDEFIEKYKKYINSILTKINFDIQEVDNLTIATRSNKTIRIEYNLNRVTIYCENKKLTIGSHFMLFDDFEKYFISSVTTFINRS
jgi:hypothetical protein